MKTEMKIVAAVTLGSILMTGVMYGCAAFNAWFFDTPVGYAFGVMCVAIACFYAVKWYSEDVQLSHKWFLVLANTMTVLIYSLGFGPKAFYVMAPLAAISVFADIAMTKKAVVYDSSLISYRPY